MHFKILVCAAAAIIAPAFANGTWLTNLEKAKEQATRENKNILISFYQPDWLACKELKNKVFDSPEFRKYAEQNLVMVEIQFPKQGELTPEQTQYNWNIAQRYPISGFPTVYLVDDMGVAFWVRSGGQTTPEEYMTDVAKGVADKNKTLAAYKAAQQFSGLEKARKLDMVLRTMPKNLRAANAQIYDEIIMLDTADTLGYAKLKAKQAKELLEPKIQREQDREFNDLNDREIAPLLRTKQYDQILTKLDEFMKKEGLTVLSKQKCLFLTAQVHLLKADIDKSINVLEESCKLDPNNETGKQAAETIKNLKENRATIEAQLKANASRS